MPAPLIDASVIAAVATAVVTAAGSAILWLMKERKREQSDMKNQENLILTAMLVLLRNQLVTAHRVAITNSEITISEKQSFLETHQLYTRLGGNGPASHLTDDIAKLRVIPDREGRP